MTTNGEFVDSEGFSTENIWATSFETELIRSKTEGEKGLMKIVHHGDKYLKNHFLKKVKQEYKKLSAEPVLEEERADESIYKLEPA